MTDQLILDEKLGDMMDLLTMAATAYHNNRDIQIYSFISLQQLLKDGELIFHLAHVLSVYLVTDTVDSW